MKNANKIFGKLDRLVKIASNNSVRNRIVTILVVLQLFTTFAVHAQTDISDCLTIDEGFKSTRATELAIDKDPDLADSVRNSGNGIQSTVTSFGAALVALDNGCNKEEAKEVYGQSQGLLGAVDSLNADIMDNPPQIDLVGHVAQQWVPGYDQTDTSAIAATSGYDYLQSINIADMAERTRLLSYVFFVLILIVAGFMIMFRQKIGGQLMVTIFNTIPNVVVGLLLVTFSFEIVGLTLDLGAMLMRISNSILGLSSNGVIVTNPFSLMSVLVEGTDGVGFVSDTGLGVGVTGIFIGFMTGVLTLPAILAGILLIAFVAIVFIASIKVYITLVKAYLGIILDTILAPIFLTAAALPGKSTLGWSWFNRVLKNVLTFVGVYFIVNLALVLFQSDIDFAFPAALTSGTFTQNSDYSLLSAVLKGIVPLALFFFAAEIPNALSDLFPADGGRGIGAAAQGIQKSFQKIPIFGSFFG